MVTQTRLPFPVLVQLLTRFCWQVVIAAACLLPSSCDSVTGPQNRIPLGVEIDGTSFRIEERNGWWRTTDDLYYTFTNRTGERVYFVNCLGTIDISLERKEPGSWREVWRPVLAACLSAPIVIQPDSVYRGALMLYGAAPGNNNAFPRLHRLNPPGTYRLVLMGALSSYQDRSPPGDPIALAHRTSNEFRISFD